MIVEQWNLGELADALDAVPDGTVFHHGFVEGYSYRGDYSDAALLHGYDVPVETMRAVVHALIGATVEGWKGGMFAMTRYTDAWITSGPDSSMSETMGSLMWALMLASATHGPST